MNIVYSLAVASFALVLTGCGATPEEACKNMIEVCDLPAENLSTCIENAENEQEQEMIDCLAEASTCEDVSACSL